MNISDELADIAISRQLILQRVSNGLSQEVAQLYTEMIDDISTTILKSGKISNHMQKTIKDIKEQLQVPDINSDMKELAQAELDYTKKAYNSAVGFDIFKNIPPEGAMSAIVDTTLIQGATIGAWMNDLKDSQAFDVERAIKVGMTLGETNVQLANRLKSTMELSMRNAQTIVITATGAIGSQARQEFFEANDEVTKGYIYNAVLDSRTSEFCRAYDNLKWDNKKKPIGHNFPFKQPPLNTHWRCRSVLIPWLKTWREMGYDEDELPVGTRSSLDGYVPQDLSFNDWLKTKDKAFIEETLGKGRAELFTSGKITMKDLISQQGRTLTLKELSAMNKVSKVVPNIDFGYGGKFNDYVKDVRPEAKMIIDKLPKPILINEIKKGGNYFPIGSTINTPAKQSTFLHEYGHHLDTEIGVKNTKEVNFNKYDPRPMYSGASTNKHTVSGFSQAYDDDLKFLKLNKTDTKFISQQKFKEDWYTEEKVRTLTHNVAKKEYYERFSDIVDSLTKGAFSKNYYTHGHGVSYYKSSSSRHQENFANLFYLWSKDDKIWQETKTLFPNMSIEFEKTMKGILDGKFD